MIYPELIPENPVALAQPYAEATISTNMDHEADPENREFIGVLDGDAQIFNFLDKRYFVETKQAIAIPVDREPDTNGNIKIIKYDGLSFEGILRCHSMIEVGRLVGSQAIRGICLAFDRVTLLPFFDGLREDHLLHVPVLAVNAIDKTG